MAELVYAAALSHGPLLATEPQRWTLRAGADRSSTRLWFRGRQYSFDGLLHERDADVERFRLASQESARIEQHRSCQVSLDELAASFSAARVDLAVIVGNDQRELLSDNLRPPLLVIGADAIDNVALSGEERAGLPPGVAEAEEGHCPPDGAQYPGAFDAARAIVGSLIDGGVDVAWADSLPSGGKQRGIPHAFGFIYRRLMRDAPPPSIPVMVNAVVEPNRPSAQRCLRYGEVLLEAIRRLPDGLRVALVASGGLTHFVVDEEIDRVVMGSITASDLSTWMAVSEDVYEGNSGEIKNWIPVASAAIAAGMSVQQADYVPCYRTEAGTGSGMGFVSWG
jgi:hypothetical protein